MTTKGKRIAYFVHDLGDAAVVRRVQMLHAGGIEVTVLGFRRGDTAPARIEGARAIDLGRTGNGQFVQRILAVLRSLARFGAIRRAAAEADVVMARNLEMLVLAARAAGRRRLIYECLDIHRLLLGSGMASRLIQAIERALLRHVDLIVTSSPRFIADYFHARRGLTTPVLLIENKVPAFDAPVTPAPAAPARAPWVIGWFGMLRCRRSLAMLGDIARQSEGRIEVVIAGIPAENEFPDFAAQLEAMPGVRYVGRYKPADLATLYAGVHFAWAIDYFEEGLNSTWLLPNRLYESICYGAVPIALAPVETGAWLARHGVGLTIGDPVQELPGFFAGLDEAQLMAMRDALAALPQTDLTIGRAECAACVAQILGESAPD